MEYNNKFIELAKKVVEANDVPMLTSSGGSEIVIEMLQSAGASPIVDGEVKLVDNEALKAAIEVYKQLIDEGIMVDYTDWDQYIGNSSRCYSGMLDHVFHSGSRGSVW